MGLRLYGAEFLSSEDIKLMSLENKIPTFAF